MDNLPSGTVTFLFTDVEDVIELAYGQLHALLISCTGASYRIADHVSQTQFGRDPQIRKLMLALQRCSCYYFVNVMMPFPMLLPSVGLVCYELS